MTHAGSEGSLSRLELVVLARMSSPKVPDPKQLGEAVRTLVLPAESPARARLRALEVVAELWQRGLVEDHPLPRRRAAKPHSVPASDAAAPVAPPKPGRRLTEGGRRALARALGLDVAPAWGKVRDEHLPALGSGLAPGSDDAHRRLASGGAVVAAELRAALGVAHAPTVTALCDALIIEALAPDKARGDSFGSSLAQAFGPRRPRAERGHGAIRVAVRARSPPVLGVGSTRRWRIRVTLSLRTSARAR